MKVQTSRFGALEIPDERIITFPEGLPGLDGRHFARIWSEDDSRWEWLQSIEAPEVALLLVDPTMVLPSYPIEPKPTDVRAIQPADEPGASRKLTCRVVVGPGESAAEMIVNLFAPVFFNVDRRLGMQVPMVGSGYAVREVWPPRQAVDGSTRQAPVDDAEA